MACIICNSIIPEDRGSSKRWANLKIKYCSAFCIKRAWYFKNSNTKNSALKNPKDKISNTQKGYFYERLIAKKLGGICVSSKRMNQDVDVVADGKNIDVKCCELYRRKFQRGRPIKGRQKGVWIFNRNKYKEQIDFFCCVCLKGGRIKKIYLIPSTHFKAKGITIGQISKYDPFIAKL